MHKSQLEIYGHQYVTFKFLSIYIKQESQEKRPY